MSAEEQQQNDSKVDSQDDTSMQQDNAASTGQGPNRKRPRLDLALEPRERKRGKTMFGLLLGTLNKAKTEDKERNASDAAKRRQQIEQKLQDKLRKETDSVRRAEEAKKEKTSAARKEEDLQLKDSIHKLRRTRLPILANFLSTADQIPSEEDLASSSSPLSTDPLALPSRSNPPPLYYLPAILTPAQDAFLKRRNVEVKEAAEKEWEAFRQERAEGVEEITRLRSRVAEEEERKKGEQQQQRDTTRSNEGDVKMGDESPSSKESQHTEPSAPAVNGRQDSTKDEYSSLPKEQGAQMEVDDESSGKPKRDEPQAKVPASEAAPGLEVSSEQKEESAAPTTMMQADEDDAVEY